MYWGSVRFFKHLIFLALAVLILVPLCLACYHISINAHLTEELIILKGESVANRMQLQKNQTESIGQPLFLKDEEKKRHIILIWNTVYLTFDDSIL